MMVMDVTTAGPFSFGEPRPLFTLPDGFIPERVLAYAPQSISGDGQRIVIAAPQPPERPEVTVAPEILASYVGTYGEGGTPTVVTLEGNQLLAYKPGVFSAEVMTARSETSFYFTAVSWEFDFVTDDQGTVTRMLQHNNGMTWDRYPRQ